METYIIDHEAQLPGQEFRVEFIDKLRDEKRFDSMEELKAQIGRDVEKAKAILGKSMPER